MTQDELVAAWAPKFEKAHVDLDELRRDVLPWVSALDLAGVTPLVAADFFATAVRSRRAAPGPDGLPYPAWAVAGEFGAATIAEAELDLKSGRFPPLLWNSAVRLFI